MTLIKSIQITCDGCSKDLSEKTPILRYFLELSHFSSQSNIVGSKQPEFEENKHFCDFRCLKKWANNTPNE